MNYYTVLTFFDLIYSKSDFSAIGASRKAIKLLWTENITLSFIYF